MKITVVVPDGVVGVDGEFRKLDLSSLDPDIRAIQWYGGKGHIEFHSSLPNELINNASSLTLLVNAWKALTPLPLLNVEPLNIIEPVPETLQDASTIIY